MIESQQPPVPQLLQIEIQQLNHEIKEVTHMNTLNRSVIKMLSESKSGSHQLFYSVITHLLQQIQTQSNRIRRLMAEKNQMSAQIYLLEKISSQINASEKMQYQHLQDEIEKLNLDILLKNNRLMEYQEKIGEIDYLVGFATKNVNIFDLNEQTLRFNEEIRQLNQLIRFKNEETEKLAKENEALLKVNMALKSELERKKDQLVRFKENHEDISCIQEFKMNSNRLNMTLPQNPINTSRSILPRQDTSFAFLRFQKQLVEDDSDSDFDPDNLCPQLAVIFKDKVEKVKKRREQVIPGLNMERVRIIMKKNRNKLNQQERSNSNSMVHVNPTQKIIDLEVELENTTRQLGKYILKEKQLMARYEKGTTIVAELEARNQLLYLNYQKISNNWRLLYKQFAFNKKLVKFIQEVVGRELVKAMINDNQSLEQAQERMKEAINKLQGIDLHKPSQITRIIQMIEKIRESRWHKKPERSNSEEL